MNAALLSAASASYTANCLLGISVATGVLDTTRMRWVHHALYISTIALSAAAAGSLLWRRKSAGFAVLPAAVPLALIPRVSARSPRHPLIAAAAAPFFGAGLFLAYR